MNKSNIKRFPPKQPIPVNAKKVFKGVIFDVYQWEQLLFDGSTTTFELLKRPDTAVIIPVTPEGLILIAEQEQPGRKPFVSVIGGRINDSESLEEGAARELKEETGYEAEELIEWDARQPINKVDWAIHTLIAKGCVKKKSPDLDSGEKIKIKKVTFDRFIDLVLEGNFSDDPQILQRVLEAKVFPEKMKELKKLLS